MKYIRKDEIITIVDRKRKKRVEIDDFIKSLQK